MKWKSLLLAGAVAGLMTANVSASTILGSFSLSGGIVVNGTSTITWFNPSNGNAFDKLVISDATGVYAGLNGQEATVETLNSSTEPAGNAGFPDQLFVVFPNGLPSLYINVVYPGVDSSAQCGLAPAPGQTCTPPLPGGAVSPFNFQNNPPPNSPQATATFAFGGDEGPGSPNVTWIGNFTSQFNVPFQTVLAELGPAQNGTVTNSVSGSFTVTSNVAAPETSTLSLCGLGLGLVLLARSRSLISRHHRG